MTATNHVVAGALIAAVVKQPALALPLAFLSHALMDALPHFAIKDRLSREFVTVLAIDICCASSILLAIMISKPTHWPLLLACAVAAACPDLIWLYYYIYELQGRLKPFGVVARFLTRIQWCELENLTGVLIELAWFLASATLLLKAF